MAVVLSLQVSLGEKSDKDSRIWKGIQGLQLVVVVGLNLATLSVSRSLADGFGQHHVAQGLSICLQQLLAACLMAWAPLVQDADEN